MTQNIYREPGQRGTANLQRVIDDRRCGLCDDPTHTTGVVNGHIFSSREEQRRRIAAAAAANDRIAAATLKARQMAVQRENEATTRRMMRGDF